MILLVNAVEFDGVAKVFRPGLFETPAPALTEVDLGIPEGEIVGLLGPNGSGKTTLLKIILGLLVPTTGICRIFGRPSNSAEGRSDVGYLPEAPEFYAFLTGTELVRFFAGLSGLAGSTREDRVRTAIGRVGMESAADRRIGTYSRGMKQRIGLAQALVAEPKLVILDEPTANLDPEGAMKFASVIRDIHARGGTVLLSTHQLDQIEYLCTWVVLLSRGRVVSSGPVEEFIQRCSEPALVVESLDEAHRSDLRCWLAARGALLRVARSNRLERAYCAATDCAAPEEGRSH